MSQRDLAKAVGVSVGAMHYVLGALVEKGLVKLDNFASAKDKRRYSYILTPRGAAEKAKITKRFLARKLEEYDALRAEIEDLKRDLEDDVHPGKVNARGR